MARYIIQGGARLNGTVRISGAKNAILPVLAASVLTSADCLITEVPRLRDVQVMIEILRSLGVTVEALDGGRALRVNAAGLHNHEIPEHLMREIRSSIFLMGALLGRLGRVRCSHPGGCAIGPRDIDLHLMGLSALGARIAEGYGYIEGEAGGLRGAEIYLDFPSVGATENIILGAVLADGVTVIRNAAKEPEIVDLQALLNRMGARVHGAGTDVVRIEGVRSLRGCEHAVIPDRIETGTFMIATAITGGEVTIENAVPGHVEAATAKLREAGAEVRIDAVGRRIHVSGPERCRAVDIKTMPYPGFPTDLQPQMMALLATAEGTSIITETIFENRLKTAEELRRMGADVKTDGRTAVIKGARRLRGAVVESPALREGAALVLAALAAEGRTVVDGTQHIDRGYDRFEDKLRGVGADIVREPERV